MLENNASYNKVLTMKSKVVKINGSWKYLFQMYCLKILYKKIKTPFIVSCPKSLYYQKTRFICLGVHLFIFYDYIYKYYFFYSLIFSNLTLKGP